MEPTKSPSPPNTLRWLAAIERAPPHRRGHAVRPVPQRRAAQSSAVDGQFGRLIFGFAVTEALGIFALLISFLLLFAV